MEFRPWMIEASHDYLKASRLLWKNRLSVPSLTTAAIGVEILFKSFLAEVDGLSGGIGEKYRFKKETHKIGNSGHNLLDLFNAIPDDIKSDLNLYQYAEYFRDYYQKPFVDDRYPYEKTASGSYSEILTDIGEEMLSKVISYYKEKKCDDPWIEKYPNV